MKFNGEFDQPGFPFSYVYTSNNKILEKLESKRHFDKIKDLFEVNNIDELIEKFEGFNNLIRKDIQILLKDTGDKISYRLFRNS
ncbi:hypothetical protein [Bacillus sp. SM2101]|uniref:hypothetical protein n=1 Tax=Bacillus sp. SM2101 TaxID=2805366 RepID=UPI001BDE193F|nr:hypothetical protein [Bacillus sp. SM2101]